MAGSRVRGSSDFDSYCRETYSSPPIEPIQKIGPSVAIEGAQHMTDTITPTATSSGLTEDEAAEFRQKCVDFMEAHAKRSGVPTIDEQKAFLAAAAEAGLAGVPFPAEYGGGGLTLAHEKIWREVKSNYTMMDGEFIISHGMCL